MSSSPSADVRIAHIGFGAFHKAHQAVYTQLLANSGDSGWGICEISLFSVQGIQQLHDQHYRYHVLEVDDHSHQLLEVNVARAALNPQRDGCQTLIDYLAAPTIALVSLTITEKGYCVLPGGARLDLDNSLIQADLAQPEAPQSAIGYLVAALALRRARGLPPFTVLSCDNLPNNGAVARAAVVQFAEQLDPALGQWIAQTVHFPSTMVDRIVPAMTEQSHQLLASHLGHADHCGIVCEPFKQWVIENNFSGERPLWENAGALLVDNVAPFEEMKLRLLNGAHSFIAYLGFLGGYDTVADAIANPDYQRAVLQLMLNEQAKTLNMPRGIDVEGYAQALLQRFANSQLRHKTAQIAMDGSQKISQRWLHSIELLRQRGEAYPSLALGVAAWLRYAMAVDEAGQAFTLRDPLAEKITQLVEEGGGLGEQSARLLLEHSGIFPSSLLGDTHFTGQVLANFSLLLNEGARTAVARCAGGDSLGSAG